MGRRRRNTEAAWSPNNAAKVRAGLVTGFQSYLGPTRHRITVLTQFLRDSPATNRSAVEEKLQALRSNIDRIQDNTSAAADAPIWWITAGALDRICTAEPCTWLPSRALLSPTGILLFERPLPDLITWRPTDDRDYAVMTTVDAVFWRVTHINGSEQLSVQLLSKGDNQRHTLDPMWRTGLVVPVKSILMDMGREMVYPVPPEDIADDEGGDTSGCPEATAAFARIHSSLTSGRETGDPHAIPAAKRSVTRGGPEIPALDSITVVS